MIKIITVFQNHNASISASKTGTFLALYPALKILTGSKIFGSTKTFAVQPILESQKLGNYNKFAKMQNFLPTDISILRINYGKVAERLLMILDGLPLIPAKMIRKTENIRYCLTDLLMLKEGSRIGCDNQISITLGGPSLGPL